MERGWLLESAPHLVEDAVKYIIFLVDANTLFDLALGMYDFSLVLMIAQHAQKVADSALVVKTKESIRTLTAGRTRENICRSFGS